MRLINFVCDCLSNIAEDDMKPVTHLLAVDLTSKRGLKFLRHGIHYLVSLSYTSSTSNYGFSIVSL